MTLHEVPLAIRLWSGSSLAVFLRAAWKRLGELPSDEAKLQYIGLVKSACPDYDGAQQGKPRGGGPGGPVFSSLADGPEDSQNGPVRLHASLMLSADGALAE